MGIPTNEAFVECLELFDRDDDFEFSHQFLPEHFTHVSDERGRALIEEALQRRHDRRVRLHEHSVMRWVTSQNVFMHAHRKMYADIYKQIKRLQERSASDDSTRTEHINVLFERLKKAANDSNHAYRFRSVVLDVLRPTFSQMHWYRGYLQALQEYFHSDVADRMTDNRKDIEKTIQVAIAGLKAVKILMSDPIAIEYLRRMPNGRRPMFWKDSVVDAQIKGLETLAALGPKSIYPIVRSNDTKRERLFVYRLSRLNWIHFRSFKSEAISSLMMLEGFERSMDPRDIDKLCKEFREDQRELLRKIDELTSVG